MATLFTCLSVSVVLKWSRFFHQILFVIFFHVNKQPESQLYHHENQMTEINVYHLNESSYTEDKENILKNGFRLLLTHDLKNEGGTFYPGSRSKVDEHF